MPAKPSPIALPVIEQGDMYVDFAIYARMKGLEPRHATLMKNEHPELFPPHIRRGPRVYARQRLLDAFFAKLEELSAANAG